MIDFLYDFTNQIVAFLERIVAYFQHLFYVVMDLLVSSLQGILDVFHDFT